MSTVKKGVLTSPRQWWKHLRPYWKKQFWGAERKAAQADTKARLSEAEKKP